MPSEADLLSLESDISKNIIGDLNVKKKNFNVFFSSAPAEA